MSRGVGDDPRLRRREAVLVEDDDLVVFRGVGVQETARDPVAFLRRNALAVGGRDEAPEVPSVDVDLALLRPEASKNRRA